MMYQQEIKFFWPLTEQIPLDLDYSVCEKPKLSCSIIGDGNSYTIRSNDLTNYSITAANLNLDVGNTVVKLKEKPSLVRRALYSGLGLKWEVK